MQSGIPGFLIEVTMMPEKRQTVRSKIYRITDEEVNLIIDDDFQLFCTHTDIERSALIISIKPVLGNVVLYAETELWDLDLIRKRMILLGGYLKGIITNIF